MEDRSAPEQPSPDPHAKLRAALWAGRGVATFTLVFALFYMAQLGLMINAVFQASPAFQGQGFSFALLSDPGFLAEWQKAAGNGDVVARLSLFSGLIGFVVLVFAVSRWRGMRVADTLAVRPAPLLAYLRWTLIFGLFYLIIQFCAQWIPGMESPYMQNVLSTASNYPMLVLGLVLMPALFEEFLFRGVLFGSLRLRLEPHTAVAITAGIFTIVHPQYSWQLQLLYLLPMAVLLGYARSYTGSIWPGIWLHALNNAISLVVPQ